MWSVHHHQGFRLAALPAEATHGVAAETAQGTHWLVAIDHYKVFITILLHHHNRNLLADFGERAQQSSLVIRACDPQPVVTQFQLMKFQLHPFRLRQNQNTTRISSCARSQGSRDSGGRNLNGSDGCSDRLRAWIRRAMK